VKGFDLPFLQGGGGMGEIMRLKDWNATPLGAPEAWPESLRSTLGLCLDSAFPIAIYWGPQLALVYNDAWRPILGDKHPWALGRPAKEVWPEIWDAIEPVFAKVIENGSGVFNGDSLLAMHRHGYVEECYFDYTFNPIREAGGRVGGIFNVVIETTYRVINERRAHMQRDFAARLSSGRTVDEVIDLAAKALSEAKLDVPFALLYRVETDPHLVRAIGLDGALAAPDAWPLREVMTTGRAQQVNELEPRLAAIPGGAWPEPVREALVLPVAMPGEAPELVLVAGASPRRALDAQYEAFLESLAGHLAAATTSAEAFQAERRRAEALADLDRAKTTFFSNVSHELRTPLTLMLGPIEDILAKPQDHLLPGDRELLTLVRRNGQRLLKLVNTLLEFSRIEAGRVQARYEQTDLAALTVDLASNFRSACERAGIRLEVDCPPLAAPAYVDRDMWERIVLNLLSNAFKFTLKGEVSVRLREEGGNAVLLVSDTGIGIPEWELPRLFERFRRIDSTAGRSHEGTGIGLALVLELAKLHSGNVTAESRHGVGSTFVVRIPLGKTHLPSEHVHEGSDTRALSRRAGAYVDEAMSWLDAGAPTDATADQDTVVVSGSRARVVLAEDNADMREYLRRLLHPRYDVETVPDGMQALEAVRRRAPDLVISDVMMPRLDGFGLLRALREDSRTRAVPFLMLSARAGEEARLDGLHAGADDYLVKPFSARELLARAGALIQLERIRAEADRRKDEFLATLAHELRNPLAPLRISAEVLRRSSDESAIRAAREVIDRQVGNMARLIDDLMDVSRFSRGKIELRRERVELATVIRSAVETSGPLIEAAGQKLWLGLPGKPLWLHADARRLAQAFANLLNNASKYSERGRNIWLEVEVADGHAVVRVCDEGVGIAPDMLGSIWEMFVQADRSLERSHGGLGIGLTVVRSLIAMHDGSVEAKSEGPGRGAEFIVRLPIIEVAFDQVAAAEPVPAQSQAIAPKTRVLVADDNLDAAQSLGMYLRMTGCEVAVANDGESALELAARFRPEVALLDIAMPGLNGFDLARRIRAEPWGRAVTLVAVTGWGQEHDRRRSADAGFDHHLVKPVTPDVIHGLLARRRVAAAND
jgi:signal transduction histidine kinase